MVEVEAVQILQARVHYDGVYTARVAGQQVGDVRCSNWRVVTLAVQRVD